MNELSIIAYNTIKEYNMLDNCDGIVVGVSGGADSMSLLHFLIQLKKKLLVVHVNHLMRGDESIRDEKHVENFCIEHNIKYILERVDVRKIARETRKSEEDAGRYVRYTIFNRNCLPGWKIATAHTLSDKVETVIYNIAKGTGLSGLKGIPAVRDNIIRPLIGVTRGQVDEYCRDNNLNYVDDSTNFETIYTRNKIRLGIVPILKEINPRCEKAIERLCKQIEKSETDIANKHKSIGTLYTKELAELSLDEIVYILKEKIKELSVKKGTRIPRVSYSQIMQAMNVINKGSGEVYFSDDFILVVKAGRVYFKSKEEIKKDKENPKIELEIDKRVTVGNYNCMAVLSDRIMAHGDFLDYSKIKGKKVYWRTRERGDKMFLNGHLKPVGKVMAEHKVRTDIRDSLVLLEVDGEIACICGVAISNKFRANSDTREVLELQTRLKLSVM